MAGASVIGALRVVLGADTVAFEDGLKGASARMDSFAATMGKAAIALGVAVAGAATALSASIKGAIDQADKLGKMAQSIGVPVAELSALKHAADLSGVGIEELSKSLGKLSKNMVEAAAKPASDAAKAFQALGVSVKNSDGTLKSSSQLLGDVAGKFANMEDGAGKTAAAMAIFGKAGAALIPLLNSGKDGIAGMVTEARELGITLDDKTAKAAEAFNDNLTRIKRVTDGIILQIASQLLPTLEKLSEAYLQSAKEGGVLKDNIDLIVVSIKFVIREISLLALAIQNLGSDLVAIGKLATEVGNVLAPSMDKFIASLTSPLATAAEKIEALKGAFRTFGEEVTKNEAAMIAGQQALKKVLDDTVLSTSAAGAAAGDAAKKKGEFNLAVLGSKNALQAFLDSQAKSLAAQQAELLTTDMLAGAKERLRVVLQAEAIAKANNITLTDSLRISMTEAANAAGEMALKLKGAQLVVEAKTPHEAFRTEMENNKLALIAFGATAQQIALVQTKTAEKYATTWGQAGESIAGSLVKIGNAFGKENKQMATLAKAAGVVQATISMFTGAAKALELPFPANLAAMAAVLATGAGLVAQIRSTTVPSFATGGSMTVGGGKGGGDRMIVPIMAEPGEQIDVWRPGQGPDPRRGAGGGDSTVTIRFTGDDFAIGEKIARKIISAVNEATGNGVLLRMA